MKNSKKKKVPEIKAADLFCGVGGLTHGLLRGGIKVVTGVDIDETCRYPFEKNNSAKFLGKDVKELDPSVLHDLLDDAPLSMLAGCAPCQPFSTYSRGKKQKRTNSDWELVSIFGRLVREVNPHFITMENVPSLKNHPVFEIFLESLKNYHIEWSIVDCASIGIPQTRKRLVLLASKLGPDKLSLPNPKDSIATVRNAISNLPKLQAGQSDPEDPLHAACQLSELNIKRIKASRPGGTWRDWDLALRATCHKKASGGTYPSVYGRMEWDQLAPTITTQCFGYGNGRFGHPEQNRAISLREAAILQTFPPNYTFLRNGENPKFHKLGRLIGNAVPVRLGEVIAETLCRHAMQYANIISA